MHPSLSWSARWWGVILVGVALGCARGQSGTALPDEDAGGSGLPDLPKPRDTPDPAADGPLPARDGPAPDVDPSSDAAAPADGPAGGCRSDGDCASDPAGTFCDVSRGACVSCLVDRPTCNAGTYCDPAGSTCRMGCDRDAGCLAGARCDLATHRCVGCADDTSCAPGTVCRAGVCEPGCSTTQPCGVGNACCDGRCVDTTSDAQSCGSCGNACAEGSACCVGRCVGTASDARHCGRCGNVCNLPGAGSQCTAGACRVTACDPGRADCDGSSANGCEVTLDADPAHCGACGRACTAGAGATARCLEGRCRLECGAGFGDCDGDPSNGCEAALAADPAHCGTCGDRCPAGPGAVARCTGGVCSQGCNPGSADCDNDPSNGCETALETDPRSCGACGVLCAPANATPACAAGRCAVGACNAGFANCDGDPANGCETSTRADNANCGTCGTRCPAGTACSEGLCASVCSGGTTFCTDRCADLRVDPRDCGGCGQACATVPNAAPTCAQGLCVAACASGFGDCDGTYGNGCEVDLRSTQSHCGACGQGCFRPNAAAACVEGVCRVAACLGGYADCNGSDFDGCETHLLTSSAHCGACGRTCQRPNATAQCTGGSCALGSCLGGYGDCNGFGDDGCETDLRFNNQHCGACGRTCAAGTACSNGTCASVCSPGQTFCAGSCVTLSSDPRHCGGCGNLCPAGRSCANGTCVDPAPSNDRCAGAIELNLAAPQTTFTANLVGANRDLSASCTSANGADVYYRFTLPPGARQLVYADTYGASFDTVLMFANGCTSPVPTGTTAGDGPCNDDSCGTLQSQVVALLNPGTYYLVVAGYGSNTGTTPVRFQHLPVGNGPLALLNPGSTSVGGVTAGTGQIIGCTGSGPENTYWWRTCHTAGAGTLTATTCSRASWDTVLYFYNGTGVGGACNDDACGLQSSITGAVSAGSGIHTLTIDGWGGSSGSYTIAVSRP